MADPSDPTAPDPGEAPALFTRLTTGGLSPERDRPGGSDASSPPLEIEYTSRGDRVPALLLRPADTKAAKQLVVLLDSEPVSGLATAAPAATKRALELARGGAMVFAPDLPLCGRRATAKLSDQLATPPPGDLEPEEHARLLDAAEQQAVADVRRGLALLCELCPELAADAPGELVASGPFAARVARALCAVEPRLSVGTQG